MSRQATEPENGQRDAFVTGAEDAARPAAGEPDPRYARQVLILAFASTVSMVIGVSSVMPMVPMLARTFAVTSAMASLVITCFTLPGIVFAMLSGVLADRYGRKAVLAPSLLLFCLGGAGCALAPDFNTLLAMRVVQGMGGAPLGVLNMAILADVWSGRRLARMIGLNTAVLSVCTAVYPTIGGLLASIHWRCVFLLPLLVFPVAVLAIRTPLAKPDGSESFREYLAGMRQAFRDRRILALLGMTMVTFVMLYGPLITCFPILADLRFGASPAIIGGIMVCSSLGTGLMASQQGALSGKFSARTLFLCSQVGYVTSLVLLPNMGHIMLMTVPVFVYGLGQGLNVPTVQAQLLQAVPAGKRASIMAANGMLLRLGQTIAPWSFSIVMEKAGADWGFYSGILLAGLLAFMALRFLGEAPRGEQHQT